MFSRFKTFYVKYNIIKFIFFLPVKFFRFYKRKILSDKAYIKNHYFETFNIKLDLKDPKTFTAKMQWLKLNDKNPLYTLCADKHKVRDYVKEKIGSKYLIPLIHVTNKPSLIPFDDLPSEYIIKTNHTSGYNLIVKEGKMYSFSTVENFDKIKLIKKTQSWLNINVFYQNREWEYKNIEPKIIIEELLQDETGNKVLNDYKFH